MVDGQPRYITPEECLMLQGFDRDFKLCGKESERYAQVGNSVPTTVVYAVIKQMVKAGVFKKSK